MFGEKPIRVIIVDDHTMLRAGLSVFLRSYSDLELVGEASNGEEAFALCAESIPDVVLMDVKLPNMDGITATQLIREAFPSIHVIALTSFGEDRLVRAMLKAGAISYLFKKISADDLAKAIRAASRGFSTFAAEITQLLVQASHQSPLPVNRLTNREREVLVLMTKGMRNNDIADTLMISLSTTKTHVSSILGKLGMCSRTEVVASSGDVIEDSIPSLT